MTIQDLEKQPDKIVIFRDFEQLKQYIVIENDLLYAMKLCLTDSEKLEVIKLDYFQMQSKYVKRMAVESIKDETVKSQIIHDLPFMESVFDAWDFQQFIKTASDEDKRYVIKSPEILQKFAFTTYEIILLIETMSNDGRKEVLLNRELTLQFKFPENEIANLIIGIKDDKDKLKFAKDYELDRYYTMRVILSCSDEMKKNMLLEGKENLNVRDMKSIMASLGIDAFVDFVKNHQEFLAAKNIKVFQVTKSMTSEKQLELVDKIDEMNLPEGEKRWIFAILSDETKKAIDPEKIAPQYRKLLELQVSKSGDIILEFAGDVSEYEGLDEVLCINPLEIAKSDEDRQGLLNLCKVCPKVEIKDNLKMGSSTVEEFITGEQWINSVIEGIQPEWTDVQKLAYIDTMIGKRVSYTPNFDTESEKSGDARALWKIITNGYGVCNGITQIEKYLLDRAGIEAEIVSSRNHSFIKVKNIQIPTENGIMEGDTLVDPTWNLTASRYGCRPKHFCKSYEELRKVDIDSNGTDHECHKNDRLSESPTIDMDIKTLREVYRSIGITDKDGKFPIVQLIEQAKQIDKTAPDMQANIKSKFALLKKWCPEFATCQNSTIEILRGVLLRPNEKFNFKRCIASRVYDREDAEKQTVLYVYIELEDGQRQFFYADKESGEFITLSQQEFEQKFECYEKDMQKMKGHKRPWEIGEKIQENKANNSREIVAEEGR